MSDERLLLVFDTSTTIGSVGLGRGTRLLASHELPEERTQASELIPVIERVLEIAGVERGDLGGIVVGRGPGSFTGVRVSAATARGLAHGLDVPIWGVSSLAAAALSAGKVHSGPVGMRGELERLGSDDPRSRFVLFDARSNRVYAGCYRVDRIPGTSEPEGLEPGRSPFELAVLVPPLATLLEVALEAAPDDAVFCGDAALRHADRIRAAGFQVAAPPVGWPTAAGLLRAHRATGGDPLARGWEPEYLRESSARPPASAGSSK